MIPRGLRRFAAILALVAFGGGAQAQAPELGVVVSPILTLDQERLFEGSRVAERVAAEIARRTEELAAENRRIETELTEEELRLTEQRGELPVDEFKTLADAFDEKVQRLRTEQDAKARDLQRLQEQERQNFLRRITPILAEIVRERGAVALMDRRSVLLSADAIDITDEAIARINAELEFDSPEAPAATPEEAPAETTENPQSE